MAETNNPATWFRAFGRSKSSLQSTTSTTNSSPNRESTSHLRLPTETTTNPTTASITTPTITTTHHGDHSPYPPTTPTPDGSPSRLRTRPAAAVRRVSSLFSLVGGSNHSNSSPKRESLFPTHALPGRAAPMGALPLGGFHSASSSIDHGGPGLQDMMGGMGVGGRRGEEQSIVWSSPNMMQMVETLRGVMMGVMRMPGGGGMDVGSEGRDWRGSRGSKGDREVEWETERRERERIRERERGVLRMGMRGRESGGLPVEYNSHVLVLLEGFGHLVEQLNKAQDELAELRNLREKEVEQFRGISEECIQRENGYKAEIKRLELVLAKESKDGVASVALARHSSLIDRSETKRFQARLKRMSSSQDADNAGEAHNKPRSNVEESPEAKTSYETIGDIPRDLNPHSDVLMSRLVERQDQDYSYRHHQERKRASSQKIPSASNVDQHRRLATRRSQPDEDPRYPTSRETTLKGRTTRERAPWYGKGQEGANQSLNRNADAATMDPSIAITSADESSASSTWEAGSSTSDDSVTDTGSPLVRSQSQRSNDSGPGLFDGTNSQPPGSGLGAIHEGAGYTPDTAFVNYHRDQSPGLNPVLASSYIYRDEGSDGQGASTQRGRPSLGTMSSQSVVERRRRHSPHLNRGYSFKRGDDEHLPVTSPTRRAAKKTDSDSMYLYSDTPRDDVSSVRSDCAGSPSTKRPARPAGLAPSTSTGSVIWRGNDDKQATINKKDDDRTPRASTCQYHGEDSDGQQ